MSQYVNCGAFISNRRAKNKKALREALAADPSTVRFDRTSALDCGPDIQGDSIPEGIILSVVLPNPYTDRKFYGSVTLGRDGKPKLA